MPYQDAWFGPGNGTSRDIRLQCGGLESKISYCPFDKNWGELSCSHSKDAGVQCTHAPIGK